MSSARRQRMSMLDDGDGDGLWCGSNVVGKRELYEHFSGVRGLGRWLD